MKLSNRTEHRKYKANTIEVLEEYMENTKKKL